MEVSTMTQPQLRAQDPGRFFEGLEALGHCSGESPAGEDRTFSLVCLRWTCYGPACRGDCPYDGAASVNHSMASIAHQLEILQRIAMFSAQAHGHSLNAWRTSEYSATAACSKCGSTVTVYVSLLQPDIEGTALNAECGAAKRGEQCAEAA
jgi:hypothetical protein